MKTPTPGSRLSSTPLDMGGSKKAARHMSLLRTTDNMALTTRTMRTCCLIGWDSRCLMELLSWKRVPRMKKPGQMT